MSRKELMGEKLPGGFVRGDVISYSYVPIRTWRPKEGIGAVPYLFEYALMTFDGKYRLERFHAENIRRIDIASKWSTAIQLYNRYNYYHDEIINLMIRCFRNRQLIILSATPGGDDPEKNAHQNLIDILETLWRNRDTTLVSPEGDKATGRQLINNILAAKLGDEGECGLRTEGLRKYFADFDREIRLREMDGQRPFSHIKGWYNMFGFAAFDYHTCLAVNEEDVEKHGRFILPQNTQAIGVDVYHYWFHRSSPFDPADLSIPRERVRAHSDEWQRIRTKYYPEGIEVQVCENARDPKTWIPECWSDTHALLQAIELAGAKNAIMWYIGLCGQMVDVGDESTYTTPIETMESYYDHVKAGPWACLSWWYFDSKSPKGQGGLDYYDRKLVHCTPEHPEGVPYSKETLDYWHDEYVAMKTRMFNDVVHNQFRHLNGRRPFPPETRPAEALDAANGSLHNAVTLMVP
jgi:hypothetical protein